jgi:predicted neuraminidase
MSHTRMLSVVLGIAAASVGFAQDSGEGIVGMTVLSAMSLADRVEDAGGRADFVFEDDRPFAQCHASTIVQAADGTLVTAWFGGTREKNPDVGIWLSRLEGGEWTVPVQVAKIPDARTGETAPHWNPVLFRPEGDTLYLFFKVGPEISHWQQFWMRSEDHGQTWTEPVELVPGDEGGRGPVRSKPIILSDGSWFVGSSTEQEGWKPFADRSTDAGETWTRSDDFELDVEGLLIRGAIQPAVWESQPGHVHALMRTNGGVAVRADSTDFGETWTPLYRTDLPNNNSGFDIEPLGDDRLILFYNPVGANWGARFPLSLAVSHDNGETWRIFAHVEDDLTEGNEFSYPAIVRTEQGFALSYTWQRQRIRAWHIPFPLMDALTAPE